MKEFFKFTFASMLGVFLSFFIIFILVIAMITAMVSSAGNEENASVGPNSIMHISLDYPIQERKDRNPFKNLSLLGFESKKTLGLKEILAAIEKAKNDENVKGIYLDASSVSAGYATVEEIRNALLDFKKSGKFVLAYSEVYTQQSYYLATAASKIYLYPEGMLDFSGFVSQVTFFKGALDKLGIEAQIVKVGTYKSAVEPFTMEKMSEPNRAQVRSYLNSLYDHFLNKISVARKVSKPDLFQIADSLKIQTAKDAFQYKLVDGLKYKDQVLSDLKRLSGQDEKKELKTFKIEDYSPEKRDVQSSADRIAVIYANGEITSGEGNDDVMGSERISRALRNARTDKKVRAVVLRVNSPGGSALASDVMWREVVLIKKVKPIIVSMGDVAASGGYYIACGADSIFAQPNTITGSIGVFGIIPNMQKLFNEKLGITFDQVKTSKFADLGDISRPLTDAERMILQRSVNDMYQSFTKKVADGRKLRQSYVDSIGQGRVWTGKEALDKGLVDRLGNIDDAVASAAKKAGLKEYRLVSYPAQVDPLKSLFDTSSDQIKMFMAKKELGESFTYYERLKKAAEIRGIQARLPFDVIIK